MTGITLNMDFFIVFLRVCCLFVRLHLTNYLSEISTVRSQVEQGQLFIKVNIFVLLTNLHKYLCHKVFLEKSNAENLQDFV